MCFGFSPQARAAPARVRRELVTRRLRLYARMLRATWDSARCDERVGNAAHHAVRDSRVPIEPVSTKNKPHAKLTHVTLY